jgi:glycosyltransferase involved in cell wall biosynthesis
MKILVISQYYPPEPGATSNRLEAFVRAMVNRDHEVTVICEFPNHPTGRLSPDDRWRLFRVENVGTHKIIRTFVLTFARKNNIKRMLFYLSFALSSFLAGVFLKRRDIVFASSPPIFHVYAAMLVAIIKRSKFILDIRDIWPDTALEFKAVSNDKLLRLGGYIERKLYRKAHLIFTVSRGLRTKISKRGGQAKVKVIYNGSDLDMLQWKGNIKSIRNSFGWSEKLVVCYAGLIGLGQDLVNLLPEIAKLPSGKIQFVFIGDGPGRASFDREAKSLGIQNISIMDLLTRSQVIPYTHAVDIMMVVLRESDFFKSAIPSKFFDCLAAGKPVVTNVDGELRELMEDSNSGLYFTLNEKGSFVRAIESLAADPQLRETMGKNGKKLAADQFIRLNLSDKAVEMIEGSFEC